ncbi:MAG: hypothetical protein ACOY46_09100 [Bacillota bacterium]
MFPIQVSTMQNYLLHRGYNNYTVGRMKTWDLMSAYNFEKKQPGNIYLPIRPANKGSSGHPDFSYYLDTYV